MQVSVLAQHIKKNGTIGLIVSKEDSKYHVSLGVCGYDVDKEFALRLVELIGKMNGGK